MDMIKKVTKDLSNVVIASSDDLVINYAKENHIDLIVRGLRTIQDYENEFSLYQFNRHLDKRIETVILFPSSKNLFVSSSAIKELVHYGADITPYVPKEIIDDIVSKIPKRPKWCLVFYGITTKSIDILLYFVII